MLDLRLVYVRRSNLYSKIWFAIGYYWGRIGKKEEYPNPKIDPDYCKYYDEGFTLGQKVKRI